MDHDQDSKPTVPHQSIQVVTSEKGNKSGLSSSKNWGEKAVVVTELRMQLKLAGPLIFTSFLQFSMQMISVMFVGHLGQVPLASASLATSFAGVTGFSLMLGMGGALETFCGQAYGAELYQMLGVYAQRAMTIFTLMGIPVSILWAFTGDILAILKQDSQISAGAGLYARWLIPSIFPYALLQCQVRFLQAQKNTLPLVISTGATTLCHALVCWTLIFKLGLGNKGASLSLGISYWLNVLILALYIMFSPTCQKTWKRFSEEALKNLYAFLRLGVPSAFMVCLEFWSYEFLVLLSAFLPNPKLETSMMSISLNTISALFRIPVGAGKPNAARLAVQVVLFLAVVGGLLTGMIAVAVRNVWGHMYTNDKELVTYLASVMPILAAANFIDSIQGVLAGCARGCGWQKTAAFTCLGAYYFVGLPTAIILTFVLHFGGKGLWIGIVGAVILQSTLLLLITLRTNWEQEATKARERVGGGSAIPS
ncbi:hypothetical protein Tsubulata_007127 [Turnera subulata]|uniref:Protein DETOXIFICATION n=1 Tax=Turnera subulata TaxID=218843 RepID=A0A9Q0GL48_9ROSI|nr:hypothetical protein Tsubulata_007127 [Turnera subulata]